eukprot:tig00001331_g8166.t1
MGDPSASPRSTSLPAASVGDSPPTDALTPTDALNSARFAAMGMGPGTPGSDGSGGRPDSPVRLTPAPELTEVEKGGARFEILHGGPMRMRSKERRTWQRPPRLEAPGPEEEAERGAAGAECVLLSGRRYLVGLRDADFAAWEGALVRLRLVFADDGEQVLPEPLIAFPRGARDGERRMELELRMNGKGYTEQRFGIAASSFLHRRRAFRLLIEDTEGTLLDSLVVWGAAPPKRAPSAGAGHDVPVAAGDAPKRLRVLGGGAGRRPSIAGSQTASGTSGASSDSDGDEGYALPDEEGGRTFREAKGPWGGPGGGDDDDLALQFQRVMHLYPGADRGPEDDPGAPPGVDPQPLPPSTMSAVMSILKAEGAVLPSPLAPFPASFALPPRPFSSPLSLSGMAPPYRHASAASRDGAVAMVHASHAAVGAVAASLGVKHPVPGNRHPPPRLVTACRDLAAALSNAEVFDSPLFRSRDGRFRARAALEDLRFSGSSELARPYPPPSLPPAFVRERGAQLESVAGAWRKLLLAAGTHAGALVGFPDPDDAALAAEHAWNAIAVLCGEARIVSADLLPAERLATPHFAGRAALRCEAMRRRAWALEQARPAPGPDLRPPPTRGRGQWRESDAALELLFGAWSELIRAGETPSRQEAALLCELADLLLRMPHRSHLGFHICTRLYWFCEGEDEDRFGEACAVRTLGWGAFMRGQWRSSRRHLERAVSILTPMSPGYRAPLERIYQTMGVCSFHTADLGGLRHYAGRSLAQTCEAYGFAYPELDYTFNWLPWWMSIIEHKVKPGTMNREPKLEDVASNLRWNVMFMERFVMRGHPFRESVVGHALFQLARAQMRCGEWAKALGSLARSRSVLYDRYPAYFPPGSARMEIIRRMEAECRGRVQAGGAWGGAPGGLNPREELAPNATPVQIFSAGPPPEAFSGDVVGTLNFPRAAPLPVPDADVSFGLGPAGVPPGAAPAAFPRPGVQMQPADTWLPAAHVL